MYIQFTTPTLSSGVQTPLSPIHTMPKIPDILVLTADCTPCQILSYQHISIIVPFLWIVGYGVSRTLKISLIFIRLIFPLLDVPADLHTKSISVTTNKDETRYRCADLCHDKAVLEPSSL